MKSYQIRYSKKSIVDLDKVWDDVYKVSKDFDTADKYVDELMNKVLEKEKIPQSGIRLLYGNIFTGYYFVNYKKYKVFYRLKENYMEVVRIIMNKRDYMKVIFE